MKYNCRNFFQFHSVHVYIIFCVIIETLESTPTYFPVLLHNLETLNGNKKKLLRQYVVRNVTSTRDVRKIWAFCSHHPPQTLNDLSGWLIHPSCKIKRFPLRKVHGFPWFHYERLWKWQLNKRRIFVDMGGIYCEGSARGEGASKRRNDREQGSSGWRVKVHTILGGIIFDTRRRMRC